MNGDGLADLMVGASRSDLPFTDAGRSYVVFGRTNTSAVELSAVAAGSGGFVMVGQTAYDGTGASVSSAGDFNGDGLADLIVGSWGINSGPGGAYVVWGKTDTSSIDLSALGTAGVMLRGVSIGDYSGRSVSAAGDVNGDGLADVIVSADQYGANNSAIGRSYVVFGRSSSLAVDLSDVVVGSGGFVITGHCASDLSGRSVSMAGDINGDGLADLIVGSPGNDIDGTNAGRSHVIFGKTDGTAIDLSGMVDGEKGFVIQGQNAGDWSGHSVSSAGDVNGDGLADLIVGAYGNASQAGRTYVIYGGTTGAFAQTAVDVMGTTGADTLSDSGTAKTVVAGAGDDTITATAASVLYGGAGADTFTINSAMVTALQSAFGTGGNTAQLARIDGGGGVDTLVLSGASLVLDLTLVANQAASNADGGSRIDSVEKINLTGSGDNTLKLMSTDVLDMSGANAIEINGRQQLMVLGNAGDTLDLADGSGTTDWTLGTSTTIGGASYAVWNHTSLATVYVSAAVTVI